MLLFVDRPPDAGGSSRAGPTISADVPSRVAHKVFAHLFARALAMRTLAADPRQHECGTRRRNLLVATSATGAWGHRPLIMGALQAAQLRCALRMAAITAAERNEVLRVTSFRMVPRLQKPAFGVARSRVSFLTSNEVRVERAAGPRPRSGCGPRPEGSRRRCQARGSTASAPVRFPRRCG